jgi:hypothetical protein
VSRFAGRYSFTLRGLLVLVLVLAVGMAALKAWPSSWLLVTVFLLATLQHLFERHCLASPASKAEKPPRFVSLFWGAVAGAFVGSVSAVIILLIVFKLTGHCPPLVQSIVSGGILGLGLGLLFPELFESLAYLVSKIV